MRFMKLDLLTHFVFTKINRNNLGERNVLIDKYLVVNNMYSNSPWQSINTYIHIYQVKKNKLEQDKMLKSSLITIAKMIERFNLSIISKQLYLLTQIMLDSNSSSKFKAC